MVALYDPQSIRAEINTLLDEARTLATLAQTEEREPDETEAARIAEIMDAVGEVDGEAGPTGLQAKLATAERYSKIVAQNRTASMSPGHVHTSSTAERFTVPKSALSHGRRLTAFTSQGGPTPEDHADAYASGRWLMAVLGHGASQSWCADHGIGNIQAVMTEGNPEQAGFLVPDEMAARIIVLREARGIFRRWAGSEPMMTDHKVVNRRKAGPTAYWVGEAATVTASDLSFNRVELTAKALAALVRMSRELDEDSAIALADRVAEEMGYSFADKEDTAGFTGDGLSTNGGIVGIVNKANDGSHTGGLYTALTGNTAYSTLDLVDFEGMAGALPEYAEAGAAWYISKIGYYASMARLMDAAGGNRIEDLGNGPERIFLGYPVRFVQVMNTTTDAQTSTAGLAILGNLSLSSLVGNRRGMTFQVLNELYAATREIGLLGDQRVAINNHSVTDPNDSTARGPVVVLKTPAS